MEAGQQTGVQGIAVGSWSMPASSSNRSNSDEPSDDDTLTREKDNSDD